MTRDEFITAVILRTKVTSANRWSDVAVLKEMNEMQPFLLPDRPRYTEWMAARRLLYLHHFYEQANRRKVKHSNFEPLNIHICAVSAAVQWPEEASMILSLPLDAVRVLLDAGNHCALMIYPMMRLIQDDPR